MSNALANKTFDPPSEQSGQKEKQPKEKLKPFGNILNPLNNINNSMYTQQGLFNGQQNVRPYIPGQDTSRKLKQAAIGQQALSSNRQQKNGNMDILKKFRYNFHYWLRNCYQMEEQNQEPRDETLITPPTQQLTNLHRQVDEKQKSR